MKGGVVFVDFIVLFVAHKHTINKQIKQMNNQKRKKQQETFKPTPQFKKINILQ